MLLHHRHSCRQVWKPALNLTAAGLPIRFVVSIRVQLGRCPQPATDLNLKCQFHPQLEERGGVGFGGAFGVNSKNGLGP